MTLADRLARELPAGITLRREVDRDEPFMDRLYASTRAEEMAQVPWPPETVDAFLRSQSALQRAHYRQHYADALLLVIERDGASIGRLYLHESGQEVRVMDIALMPAERGRGLGTTLMASVTSYAGEQTRRVTLHVEPSNPAQRLYARVGFHLVEHRGIYDFLEWLPPRPLDQLTANDFEHAGPGGFAMRPGTAAPVGMVLSSVTRRSASAPGGRAGFALVFDSDSSAVWPQRIYRVEHEELGVMDLFLVPIGRGPSGTQYEAVFG